MLKGRLSLSNECVGVSSSRIYSVLVDPVVSMETCMFPCGTNLGAGEGGGNLTVRLELDLCKTEGEWGSKRCSA